MTRVFKRMRVLYIAGGSRLPVYRSRWVRHGGYKLVNE
jgi:hypothetical protein